MSSSSPIAISIIIPAYNEQHRISSTLEKIQLFMDNKGAEYEIIVVDDGSGDKTVSVVESAIQVNPRISLIRNGINKGKGYSVKNGFLNARGQYLLFSDADLSTPIEEMDKLINRVESGFDGAIGSRALKESDIIIHQPWYRETMGKIFNVIVRTTAVNGFKDTQCGFKCFTNKVGQDICRRQLLERFSFDVEMLYIAKKHKYNICEVPVKWLNNPATKVSAIRDSIRMFFDLLVIRANDFKGKYN